MQRKAKGSNAGPVGRRERRPLSAEFKADAVRMMQERRAIGVPLAQVARELEGRAEQLRWWAHRAGTPHTSAVSAPGETLEREVRPLRRENETLRLEQADAQKSGGVLRERVTMKYAVITRHATSFQCDSCHVCSRSRRRATTPFSNARRAGAR